MLASHMLALGVGQLLDWWATVRSIMCITSMKNKAKLQPNQCLQRPHCVMLACDSRCFCFVVSPFLFYLLTDAFKLQADDKGLSVS